jgi:uncharacterized lipoprotein YddW (UPF0748 family)
VRALVALIVLSLSACSGSDPSPDAIAELPPVAAEPRRGIWVLAEGSQRTLESRSKIERLVVEAERSGVSDLFVQVYRGGRSWYASTSADDTPYREALAAVGENPLGLLTDLAHSRGLRVHAWFNALSLSTNRDAPLLRRLGRDAVLVDRRGRSLLDYPRLEVPAPDRGWLRMGTPGIWLDPAAPGVIEGLEQAAADLARAAPDLDGLHLDFIRHPMALPLTPGSRFDGLDFGYGAAARAAFERESGARFARGDAWDHFRRDAVSRVVRRLRASVPRSWALSAAVLPWADRAYLIAMQDWRRWLEEGWLDFAVAMAYTRDDRLLRYVAHGLRGGVAGDRVWLGLGTWLHVKDPATIRRQTAIVSDAEPVGVAFFSWDSVAEVPDALAALRPAVSEERGEEDADDAALEDAPAPPAPAE